MLDDKDDRLYMLNNSLTLRVLRKCSINQQSIYIPIFTYQRTPIARKSAFGLNAFGYMGNIFYKKLELILHLQVYVICIASTQTTTKD